MPYVDTGAEEGRETSVSGDESREPRNGYGGMFRVLDRLVSLKRLSIFARDGGDR